MNTLPENYTDIPFNLDDASTVVDMLNSASRELVGFNEDNLQDDLIAWNTPGFTPAEDARVILSPEGEIAGYADLWDIVEPHVHMSAFVRVHPQHRGKGIGTFLTNWVETHARANLSRCLAGARVSILHRIHVEDAIAAKILQAQGYYLLRTSFDMQIDLQHAPEVSPAPDGLVVRVLQPGQERPFLATIQEAFRDHWGFIVEPFEVFYARWMRFLENSSSHDLSLWFAAWDGEQMAGACLCRPTGPLDPSIAWVNQLGVRRAWRKRGLGLHLLQYAFAEFFRRGSMRVGLAVDSSSLTGAVKLYQRAGMHIVRQHNTYEKELRSGVELATTSLSGD